ncbi:MBL fold metallo-hydrolase [Leuconostoc gelidum subsp. gelidum]|uniref:MBL fold metallo-hydrolase n=1 Tax=Leuconostoc gelidum subsp. gelidum TaxID=1607839 RepID=A0AB35G1B7_LEUGE|nr:MBL fold metallo-hydrolase [Leuconostoc gelidum]MBZ5963622.1 MBL fold metallo-hydrolase [Leuconostoc gelidum subsp. gelidum]MBZ5975535.1 MBL fold metallo-hydrolase [Leuconostoc gelidum subsp. gelidum]MBZ5976296.1 MBL fold metallo-hydrolase [Leuconostoc gelidum subsp. gelidum]MBZ5987079.1 MBL fold metallo-hydrolase [Leuconostoc gelidum subsp. gelidum]MBZ6016470.1 MBL fold metallo-hydrolase [Leuconostoc gelidum subsp. gelidum]
MSMQVKFLNGLNTIGGNVVSFTQGKTRLVMDFGVNFAPSEIPTGDLLANGTLPDLPDLFTDAHSEFETTIFVSHLHLDHMGALKYLTKPTDVYMSQASADLYYVLTKLGIESAPYANIKVIDFENPTNFGKFEVTFFETDHDARGAAAIRIRNGEHTVVHSGDVRLDGPHPERVNHWADILRDENIDLLLLEGTEFSFDEDNDISHERHTEMSLQQNFAQILQDSEQLVVINPYERNIDRLVALQETVHADGREMRWDHQFATILRAMGMTDVKEIDWATVLAQPDHYVVQNHFNQLHDLDQFNGAYVYLHMNGEPLGEYDPRFAELSDYLTSNNVLLRSLGVSGHATPNDLVALAQHVNAQKTVTWHSFKPEKEAKALREVGLNVYLPAKGEILNY